MTIAFRAFATMATAASGDITAPVPAGMAQDDIIFIWTLQRHSSGSSTNTVTLTGGSASIFTQLVGYNTDDAGRN